MSPLRGIALKLTAVSMFLVMAALIKATSDVVPPGEAVFFRSAGTLPIILVWLAWRGDLKTGLKTARPMGHIWRGVIGTSAMACNFAALGLLPLPEVTALGYLAPILTVLFAVALLGERVRVFRLSMVLLGLVGVVIILWPRLTLLRAGLLDTAALLGIVLVLASACFRGLAHVHIRKLTATEETSAIVFWFSITATLLSLLTLPFGWRIPGMEAMLMLIGAGLIGGVAQIALTSAYRYGNASLLAPFDYASILLATAVGYIFFDETPTSWMIAGSCVVMAAGLAIVFRERYLGIKRGKARSGLTPQG
ncbi:Permease of the drug/metabolite transporter (DMT) superfamily [Poseidonocella pacifica]|uniref:Permease of the drug/metabolite transporter (DMT) superfamily n=1 Tax=Poseidonocella pacifica TaxID=871651 RepID=A0A1I0Z271_9RHOB|nr:DMT family transporter [Poseidonocella pacifica]SFB18528.1 Permease of the drug/metabolite transporter (DMT) superfamily [Poseidonocella pacifica]